MVFTYDLSTERGQVRLLIPDRDPDNPIFEDAEIDGLLGIEVGVKSATALALETIASDEALVQKVMKQGPVTTDGASVARALLLRAQRLREQVASGSDDGAGSFGVIEVVYNQFGLRDRLLGQAIRDAQTG